MLKKGETFNITTVKDIRDIQSFIKKKFGQKFTDRLETVVEKSKNTYIMVAHQDVTTKWFGFW